MDEPALAIAEPELDLAEIEIPAVEAYDVCKKWQGMSHPVLDDTRLVVKRGAAVYIGGRNGIGKTTLLRIVAGLIKPDAGTVRVNGLHPELNRKEFQRRVGFLSAGDRGLYARLSVRRHLDFWARLFLMPPGEAEAAVEHAIDRFFLHDLLKRRADRLSMGQRQRVRLAGLFLHSPDVVLLDEPRNSLDDEGIEVMTASLTSQLDRGGAVVWCSPRGEETGFDFAASYSLEEGRLRLQ